MILKETRWYCIWTVLYVYERQEAKKKKQAFTDFEYPRVPMFRILGKRIGNTC